MTNHTGAETMKHDQLEVISTYTDAEAVDDGMLVPIEANDRATRPLWDCLVRGLPEDGQPPNRWPVALLQWFGSAGTDAHRDLRAKASLVGLLGSFGREARRIYDENIDGGILALWIDRKDDGPIVGLCSSEKELTETGVRIWILPNEIGGLTVMFPEDY